MNRFILDTTAQDSARALCDKHVVKMVLEEAQILSTALQLNGIENSGLYKPTHINHPVVKWTASCRTRFHIGLIYFDAVAKEYTYRYDKVHKSYDRLYDLFVYYMPKLESKSLLADNIFPCCAVGTTHGTLSEVVHRYRAYYRKEKAYMATWNKNRKPPYWWEGIDITV